MKTYAYSLMTFGSRQIVIGRQGENLATRIDVDVTPWKTEYPTGTISLFVVPPVGNGYLAAIEEDGNTIRWTIRDTDTAYDGHGKAELILKDASGTVMKSVTAYTICAKSPSAAEPADPPEAIRPWVEQILEAIQVEETDPTVPDWAKQPSKPTYTASEVGALPSSYTPPVTSVNSKTGNVALSAQDVGARPDTWTPSASEVGADAAGTASGAVAAHNVSGAAHADLRALIDGLTSRLNALADSDDTTLDQLSEIVAYIKSNKTLIDAVTTGKVSTSDIVDNLTTNSAGKVLSAAQGVRLKALIDAIVIPDKLPNPQPLTINGQSYDGSAAVTVTTVEIDDTLTQSGKAADAKAVGDQLSALNEAIDAEETARKQDVNLLKDDLGQITESVSIKADKAICHVSGEIIGVNDSLRNKAVMFESYADYVYVFGAKEFNNSALSINSESTVTTVDGDYLTITAKTAGGYRQSGTVEFAHGKIPKRIYIHCDNFVSTGTKKPLVILRKVVNGNQSDLKTMSLSNNMNTPYDIPESARSADSLSVVLILSNESVEAGYETTIKGFYLSRADINADMPYVAPVKYLKSEYDNISMLYPATIIWNPNNDSMDLTYVRDYVNFARTASGQKAEMDALIDGGESLSYSPISIDAEYFGVHPNGQNEDISGLINSAISRISALGGGTLRLKKGRYHIANTIRMKNGVHLEGLRDLTEIRLTSGASENITMISMNSISAGSVSNLSVIGIENHIRDNGMVGIDFPANQYCNGVTVHDVTIKWMQGTGIRLNQNCYVVSVFNINIEACYTGIHLNDATDCVIDRASISTCIRGIWSYYTGNMRISNVKIYCGGETDPDRIVTAGNYKSDYLSSAYFYGLRRSMVKVEIQEAHGNGAWFIDAENNICSIVADNCSMSADTNGDYLHNPTLTEGVGVVFGNGCKNNIADIQCTNFRDIGRKHMKQGLKLLSGSMGNKIRYADDGSCGVPIDAGDNTVY